MEKRCDKKHRLLKTGESERPDGYYQYRYTDRKGKRHTITAGTLEELRKREEQIARISQTASVQMRRMFRWMIYLIYAEG